MIEKFCARLSTHLIFVSKNNEEEARTLGILGEKSHSLIRSGIQVKDPSATSPVRDELTIPKDAWVVSSVGNFKPQKNPMGLAQTAQAVLDQDTAIHFNCV